MHLFLKFILNETLHASDNYFVHQQDQDGISSSILILLKSCLQTCMTFTIAVFTVKNSWWWTEELSETCTVSFQNKFQKLLHLAGFIIRTWHTTYITIWHWYTSHNDLLTLNLTNYCVLMWMVH